MRDLRFLFRVGFWLQIAVAASTIFSAIGLGDSHAVPTGVDLSWKQLRNAEGSSNIASGVRS